MPSDRPTRLLLQECPCLLDGSDSRRRWSRILTNRFKQVEGRTWGLRRRGITTSSPSPRRALLFVPSVHLPRPCHVRDLEPLSACCAPVSIGRKNLGVEDGLCRYHASTSAQTIRTPDAIIPYYRHVSTLATNGRRGPNSLRKTDE